MFYTHTLADNTSIISLLTVAPNIILMRTVKELSLIAQALNTTNIVQKDLLIEETTYYS